MSAPGEPGLTESQDFSLVLGGSLCQFLRRCARYWMIAPRTCPRGVFTFRTLEDAHHEEPGCTDSRS